MQNFFAGLGTLTFPCIWVLNISPGRDGLRRPKMEVLMQTGVACVGHAVTAAAAPQQAGRGDRLHPAQC